MIRLRTCLLTFIMSLMMCFLLTGCGKAEATVYYYVDGIKAETVPDRNFYDIISVESDNEEANVVWDAGTWSLSHDELSKDTVINVYFQYTASPFKCDGVGYATMQEAFDAAVSGSTHTIHVTADYNGYGVTPVDSDIVLNLNGYTLDGMGYDTITCGGKLLINGEGTIRNTIAGDYSKSLVNYGTLTVNNVKVENTTANVSIWNSNNGGSVMIMNNCTVNREDDCIVIINSGDMTLNACTVTGAGTEIHPVIYNNAEIAILRISDSVVSNTGTGYDIYRDEGIVDSYNTTVNNPYGLEKAE
ncbi:MAG: hypothetical protein IJ291_05455 [Lachnospiraceae bacterium]|nr:hypothetical protein [Lachnospiraceae bacterium]